MLLLLKLLASTCTGVYKTSVKVKVCAHMCKSDWVFEVNVKV